MFIHCELSVDKRISFYHPQQNRPIKLVQSIYSQDGDFYPEREGEGSHVTGSDDGIVITTAASVLELSKRHREISQYGARKRPLLMTYSMLAL